MVEEETLLAPPDELKEPPKRWVNWLRAPFPWFSGSWMREVGPGDVEGKLIWPTKDIAETKAAEELAHWSHWIERGGEYLGAWPEGERPA